MNTSPKLRILYAWKTPYNHGATYESQEEAENQDRTDAGENLLRLYVDPDGKIVHTEVVE
jgi:hypothetical protein